MVIAKLATEETHHYRKQDKNIKTSLEETLILK